MVKESVSAATTSKILAEKVVKHPQIDDLFRRLFLLAANSNYTLALIHVPGKVNSIVDALLRNLMSRFFSLVPQANRQPTPIPFALTQL